MPSLESDKVDKALRGKMQSKREDRGDWYYPIHNDTGIMVASTSISIGAKHTLRDKRVAAMAAQLCLMKAALLVDLVHCRLARDAALKLMEDNCPPGTPKLAHRQATARPQSERHV